MEEEINGISKEYSSHKLVAISSQFVDDKKSLISYTYYIGLDYNLSF